MSERTKILGAVCSVAALLQLASYALADIPSTFDVVYRIHDDPNDPNSPTTFSVWLKLKYQDSDANSIGWRVDEIQFRDPGLSEDTVWTETSPSVSTGDGLWWVDHQDTADPQLDEFDDPPHLKGVAAADDPNDVDLDYDFEGSGYSGPPVWSPTAGLDYDFELVGNPPTGVASGTDEPVGVAEDDNDPPMT